MNLFSVLILLHLQTCSYGISYHSKRAVVVLGQKLNNSSMSEMLLERLLVGAEVGKNLNCSYIILSGGITSGIEYYHM
jgi:hypothetical protein